MSWKSKVKPNIPCPYCGHLYFHIADAWNCADLNIKEAENKERKLIPITNEQKDLLLASGTTG